MHRSIAEVEIVVEVGQCSLFKQLGTSTITTARPDAFVWHGTKYANAKLQVIPISQSKGSKADEIREIQWANLRVNEVVRFDAGLICILNMYLSMGICTK